MTRRPPRSTRTDTLFPYTTLVKGKLALIDVNGKVLQPVNVYAMPDRPLVVGPNANQQTAELNALMEAVPALKPMLAGATWVGNRRWDLRFQTGETLSLPEGKEEASTALVNFARMDGVNRLLGRDRKSTRLNSSH